MTSTLWNFQDPQTLAEYVELTTFQGILQQRIGIAPDHAAILLRDGQLVGVYQGAHFAVGGLWQNIKQYLGGSHALRLLVVDLKPFDIEGSLESLSKDALPVAATVSLQFQINPEKPQNILGLMQHPATLTKTDVYKRLLPHLQDRVFNSVLSQLQASEIRGNTVLQDRLQAAIMQEAERVFGDLGIMVRHVSLNWALNDAERAALRQRQAELEQEQLDFEFAQKKRALTRTNEATAFTLQSELATEKLKACSEDELRHLLLQQELNFQDSRETGIRSQEIKKLAHEIDVLNIERRAHYTKALEDAQTEMERAKIRQQLTAVELETDELKALQKLRLDKLQQEQELSIAERARKQQIETLRALNDNELDVEQRRRSMNREDLSADHQRALAQKQHAAQAELEKLKLQAGMSPDQLLALNAGLSPDVARIFAERAKTEGLGAAQQQALLREMLALSQNNQQNSDAQARFFFEKALQGVVGVSQGGNTSPTPTPGHTPPGPDSASPTNTGTIECSACQRQIPGSDRFCRFCGSQIQR